MTTPPADPLDARAAILAPLGAMGAMIAASLIISAIAGTLDSVAEATGQDIPFLLGGLLLTLGALGGLTEVNLSIPLGDIGLTFVFIPFLLTGFGIAVLFHVHRASERRRPCYSDADRIMNSATSGMILLICSVLLWFLSAILNPDTSRASLTANVFFLSAGSLLVGTGASYAGRVAGAITDRSHLLRPAFVFTLRYILATGLAPAIAAAMVLTFRYEWGASAWLLIGNLTAAAWVALTGGIAHWSLETRAIGGVNASDIVPGVAVPEAGWWTWVLIAAGIGALVAGAFVWSTTAPMVPRYALALAFGTAATVSISAGTYATGYIMVGADAVRLSALGVISPLSIFCSAAVGFLIDALARGIAATRSTRTGSPSTGPYLHPQGGTPPGYTR